MSEQSKIAIQAAIELHMLDEGMLQPGELVTEWLVLTGSLPEQRTRDEDSLYTVISPGHMMSHHADGLAAWYLFRRRDTDRRDRP